MHVSPNRRRSAGVLPLAALVAFFPAAPAPAQSAAPRTVEATADDGSGESKAAVRHGGKLAAGPNIVSQGFVAEVEPNGTAATATPLPGTAAAAEGLVYPNGDVDFYSFTAAAGDSVFAATMTAASPSGSSSILDVIGTDGTTVLETDTNEGSLGGGSSSIAGAAIPANGTYYLRVRGTTGTTQIRPYRLYFQLRNGTPTAEVEPNDSTATATPLPAGGGWASGAISSATDAADYFSLALNAGDTVFLSLDADPERDVTTWNPRLGFGTFGNFILVVNDASTTSPNSEAFFMTVRSAGTYYVFVDPATAGSGTATSTFRVAAAVFPAVTPAGVTCTAYASTDVPKTIGPDPASGITTSTLTIPAGTGRIVDVDVSINLTHNLMADLDVNVVSPAGNEIGLFNDVGTTTAGVSGLTDMNLVIDDEAAFPVNTFTVMNGVTYQPETFSRLYWLDGEDPAGSWSLQIRDDTTGNGGTLNGWGLTVCTVPPPAPSCPSGTSLQTVLSTDFESGDAGFTHSATIGTDDWARGTPGVSPITTCASGTNCWKTNLAGTYTVSSSMDLLSPAISLAGFVGPVSVSWAQRFQLESASFDHAYVDVEVQGGGPTRRLWEWLDGTMTFFTGNPSVTLNQTGGWGVRTADVSSFRDRTVQLRFHLDTDTSGQYAGLAIDDVSVTGCRATSFDRGDAPDSYGTLAASNGPSHGIVTGVATLGSLIDGEADGQPTANADGDDLAGTDDEDGVTIPLNVVRGSINTFVVNASATGLLLNAWMDFDANGSFGAGEQVATDVVLAAGANNLNVLVPVTTPLLTPMFCRFRVSTNGGLGPTGAAGDGEVEDYVTAAVTPVELTSFTAD